LKEKEQKLHDLGERKHAVRQQNEIKNVEIAQTKKQVAQLKKRIAQTKSDYERIAQQAGQLDAELSDKEKTARAEMRAMREKMESAEDVQAASQQQRKSQMLLKRKLERSQRDIAESRATITDHEQQMMEKDQLMQHSLERANRVIKKLNSTLRDMGDNQKVLVQELRETLQLGDTDFSLTEIIRNLKKKMNISDDTPQ